MKQGDCKSGFVAMLGRPNVGKSTLLNSLVGNKISIVSAVPQTTRYQIRGILNVQNPQEKGKPAQIVFVDTPGIHSFKDTLVSHLNTIAKRSLEGCDLILYVVDISRRVGKEELVITELLTSQKTKVIMVLNKIDLGKAGLNEYVNLWRETIKRKKRYSDPLVHYLPLSAKTGKNIDVLKEAIVENLPLGPLFYELDMRTDFPLKFRIADIIREKLFLHLKKELPHSLAVEVEEIDEERIPPYIKANIYVNRPSQKKIVIGQNGAMIKNIGQQARQDIEKIYNRKVYVDIWVKVMEDWQRKTRILKELGYWWA
ncbi:MAG: GTPase Era [Candidatus Omnitrophota bacterium]|nr:MAG: GTPase Era [Candidatus Omnitrophota bacterium]